MTTQDDSPNEQARSAIAQGVIKIVEAEGWLEDAAKLSPSAETELLRLAKVLHETAVATLEARDLLKGEK